MLRLHSVIRRAACGGMSKRRGNQVPIWQDHGQYQAREMPTKTATTRIKNQSISSVLKEMAYGNFGGRKLIMQHTLLVESGESNLKRRPRLSPDTAFIHLRQDLVALLRAYSSRPVARQVMIPHGK